MDHFTIKKWFVHIGEHYQGPFSFNEIQERLSQGVYSYENYVWTQGMLNWKKIDELDAFKQKSVSNEAPLDSEKPPFEGSKWMKQPLHFQKISEQVLENMQKEKNKKFLFDFRSKFKKTQNAWLGFFKKSKKNKKQILLKKQENLGVLFSIVRVKFYLFVFLLLMLGPLFLREDFLHSFKNSFINSWNSLYRIKVLEKVPFLSQWISIFPDLQGVSLEDAQLLNRAAIRQIEPFSLAPSVSKDSDQSPFFYIAGALLDGTQVQVDMIGIEDTLLNARSFHWVTKVGFKNRLAKTSSVSSLDGKKIPQGEYLVLVSSVEDQSEEVLQRLASFKTIEPLPAIASGIKTRVLYLKSLFLGGVKDSIYLAELQNYHEFLKKKASDTLNDLSDYLSQLEIQSQKTLLEFEPLGKKKPSSKEVKHWLKFHQQWIAQEVLIKKKFFDVKKFDSSEKTINEKTINDKISNQDDDFGTSLFIFAQQVQDSVSNLHTLQTEFLFDFFQKNRPFFEAQLHEMKLKQSYLLSELKTKIQQARDSGFY